ncbi:LysR family transcriptional regulator [Limibaculum sp. FT325]|uniref:winged helix-turn-helix domain-containing protein n=1 Tax=Thermohalobaculum sediminis TaxID=2939436 RepID=UPI0020BE35C4|nr:LysR family transcriptional regulator [Limibaculum sediminis]MCL5777460.1 LysR family transcriptional regulator [Limibaculum sediminis]
MRRGNRRTGIRLRVVLAPGIALGPGKADLLEGIRDTGSIAAAGRRLGMSYKRAWQLVETLNGYFREPLVEASKGGSHGGGAALTPMGAEVLARFRRIEASAAASGAAEIGALGVLLPDMSEWK